MSTTATSQMTYVPPMLGQAEASAAATSAAATASASGGTLGQNDFLKLLVTQLQQQDPLNPMDDTTYVAELAQFSSLEQLTNINTGITSMNTSINQQGQVNALNFIGKDVTAAGSSLVKSGTDISQVSYTLGSPASAVQATIFDASGNIVKTVNLGAQNAGTFNYTWDGTNASGSTMADGTYSIAMNATGADGSAMTVTPQVSGTVTGVQNSNGTYMLTLADGRQVNLLNISNVNNNTSASN